MDVNIYNAFLITTFARFSISIIYADTLALSTLHWQINTERAREICEPRVGKHRGPTARVQSPESKERSHQKMMEE